jgi:hypothetical protein
LVSAIRAVESGHAGRFTREAFARRGVLTVEAAAWVAMDGADTGGAMDRLADLRALHGGV